MMKELALFGRENSTSLRDRSRLATLMTAAAMGTFSLLSMGCEVEVGSGDIVSETRTIPKVSKVSVCCSFHVDFAIGDEPELVVTADDNLIDDVEIDVDDGVLEIDWDEDSFLYDPSRPVHLELTLPRLSYFALSGGGRLDAGDISSERLKIQLEGGSRAKLSQVFVDELRVDESGGSIIDFDLLSAKKTSLESSGGSSFRAEGLSNLLDASVSGGGNIRATDLITDNTLIDLSGGSRAELTVVESLRGEASGGSIIELKGDPRTDVELSGGSKLRD